MPAQPLWSQETLLPPDVVTLTLRVGVIGPDDHLQALLEVHNATDDVLLAMESLPHRSIARAPEVLDWVRARLEEHLLKHVGPF